MDTDNTWLKTMACARCPSKGSELTCAGDYCQKWMNFVTAGDWAKELNKLKEKFKTPPSGVCEDNRDEIIQKAKDHLLKATNIKDSKEEMQVLDNFLFRCWQMGWLKQYE